MSEPSTILIARGQLSNKLNKDKLRPGELFWLTRNENGPSSNAIWSDGELYIGTPDLVSAEPMQIGGTRQVKSLVYQGEIVTETEITDSLFKHARIGDFWLFSQNASSGTFSTYKFKKDDFLLVTSATVDSTTGLTKQDTISFIRVNNSSSSADLVSFDNSNSDIKATTVQEALKELESEKLSWRGILSSNAQIAQLKINDEFDDSTFWYESVDGLTFSQPDGSIVTGKRGDFWVYKNSTAGWDRIPSGNTDAADIDYNNSSSVASQMASTFSASHKTSASNLSTVQAALEFLIKNKAQVDENGKILNSQLPSSIIGAMRLCGTWNPIISSAGIDGKDVSQQSSWPTVVDETGANALTDGCYFIVHIDNLSSDEYDTANVNIQYYDKTKQDSDGNYTRVIEFNEGDWIIYYDGTWTKIDNTNRLSAIKFDVNGSKSGTDIVSVATTQEMKANTPELAADYKLALYKNSDAYVIAGMRLVDQIVDYNGKDYFVPRYAKGKYNTLENSNIEDYDYNGTKNTIIHSTLNVGSVSENYQTNLYGNLNINSSKYGSNYIVVNIASGKTIIVKAQEDTSSNTVVYLPSVNGTLITTYDIKNILFTGNQDYIPIFTDYASINGDKVRTIVDSKIHQVDSAVINKLMSFTSDAQSTTDFSGYSLLSPLNDEDFINKYYSSSTYGKNVVIDSDVLIGGSSDNALHITKALSLGNGSTNVTYIIPGRTLFPNDRTYFHNEIETVSNEGIVSKTWVKKEDSLTDVYLEMPSVSGVILTSNSRIDGGEYLTDDEAALVNTKQYIIATDDWKNSVHGVDDHSKIASDVNLIYKPDQSVNTSDDVAFNSVTVEKVYAKVLTNVTNNSLTLLSDSKILVRKSDGTVGTLDGDLNGTADTANIAYHTFNKLLLKNCSTVVSATTSDISFDGYETKEKISYLPDQDVNSSSKVHFRSVKLDSSTNGEEKGSLISSGSVSSKDLFINVGEDYNISLTKKYYSTFSKIYDDNGNRLLTYSAPENVDLKILKNKTGLTNDILSTWGLDSKKVVYY